MNILVTGGCGFIGSHLVDRIAKENKVVVIDKKLNYLNDDVLYFKQDLVHASVDDLEKIIEEHEIDTIFHLAAQVSLRRSFEKPSETVDNNVLTTVKLAEASRN